MGYIPDDLSADEARNLYAQAELSTDEALHLSGGSYNPKGHSCGYNSMGQKGYFDDDDRWHSIRDDD